MYFPFVMTWPTCPAEAAFLASSAHLNSLRQSWLSVVLAAQLVGVPVDQCWGRVQFLGWGHAHAPDLDAVGLKMRVQYLVAVNVVERLVVDAKLDLARRVGVLRAGRLALFVLWLVVRNVVARAT